MNNKLYSSAEAARLLGISDGTVRSWLSRYPEAFQADIHIVQQDGKKLWTESGLELLRQRAAENAAPFATSNDAIATEDATENIAISTANSDAIATDPDTQHANNVATTSFNDAIVDGFTDKLALEIASAIAEKIPNRVLHHVQRMLHGAPSYQEREILNYATTQQLQLLPGVEKKYLALPQSK